MLPPPRKFDATASCVNSLAPTRGTSTPAAAPGPSPTVRRTTDVRRANPVDGDLHRDTVTDLDPDQLAALLRTAWVGFYLRPRPMARLLHLDA